MNRSSMFVSFVLALAVGCCLTIPGCGRATPSTPVVRQPVSAPPSPGKPQASLLPHIDLPQPSQRLGTAVVILVDVSGSMQQTVGDHAGHQRPKHEIAGAEAAWKIIQFTDAWQKKHTETPLYLGIKQFFERHVRQSASHAGRSTPGKRSEAVLKIPHPVGGTAIGLALSDGFHSLYSTGCIRKHLEPKLHHGWQQHCRYSAGPDVSPTVFANAWRGRNAEFCGV